MTVFKRLLFLSFFISITTQVSLGQEQNINDLLTKYELVPQMISYHPDGEWFISTQSSGDNKSVLVRLRLGETKVSVDTLNFGYYLNISKLANDGDHLLYSFLDTTSMKRMTYKRSYKNGVFEPHIDVKAISGIPTLTYFMMNAQEDIYYYTYSQNPKGLYLTRFENEEYLEPELVLPNKPNLVPFSPFLLDKSTMILSQHGVDDYSVNGIYVSRFVDGKWNEPIKLEGLPYGWSIGIAPDKDEIIYLLAGSKKVKFLNKKDLISKINKIYQ